MTQTISPGRWRGLKTTSTDNYVFTILAFDQRGSYRRMLPEGTSYETAVEMKCEVISALSPHASAVLLDASYGFTPALTMSGGSGLLLSLEKSGYTGESTYREMAFDDDWTIGKIKRFGASAVKLLVYYHPGAGELADKNDALIKDLCDTCHTYDIPIFVEPVSYSLDADVPKSSAAFAETRPEVVRETARRLAKLQPDVLKLEFPVDVAFDDDVDHWLAACEAVSEVSEVPWVLLSAGVDFETFERQLEVACAAGASGFLAGRAIWKEMVDMSPDERQRFLAGAATERIQRLAEITADKARPWNAFYAIPAAGDEWYRSYTDIGAG
jgi:tagatose 1,6-diphosphate aldolase